MKQIFVLDDKGRPQCFLTLADFLVTLPASDLTTALADVLEVDRHDLANLIGSVQVKALMREKQNA